MRGPKNISVALTIAGSDSGGGAGIQADLKVFAALGVHGVTAITCLTAQNPRRVLAIEPASPKMVCQQLEAIFEAMPPAAIKTGMLYSASIIREVSAFLRRFPKIPLVVDPVMVATSGANLLQSGAAKAMQTQLLKRADLVTPNLAEASALTGLRIHSPEDLRAAARQIHDQFGCAVVAKGGHLRGLSQAVDIFYDGREELLLSAPFVPNVKTHGTGCTFSAAVAGYLALGRSLPKAVSLAKECVFRAIERARSAGGHSVLSHSP